MRTPTSPTSRERKVQINWQKRKQNRYEFGTDHLMTRKCKLGPTHPWQSRLEEQRRRDEEAAEAFRLAQEERRAAQKLIQERQATLKRQEEEEAAAAFAAESDLKRTPDHRNSLQEMRHRRNSVAMKASQMETQTSQIEAERIRFEAEMADARKQLEEARKKQQEAELRSLSAIKARDDVAAELTSRSRAVAQARDETFAAKRLADEEKAQRLKMQDLRAQALAREAAIKTKVEALLTDEEEMRRQLHETEKSAKNELEMLRQAKDTAERYAKGGQ